MTTPTDNANGQGWRDGLTPAQVELVEKAGRRMYERRPRSSSWDALGWDALGPVQSIWFGNARAALEGAGVLPQPPKPKTPGEIVADLLTIGPCGSASAFRWGEHILFEVRTGNDCGAKSRQQRALTEVRTKIAAAVNYQVSAAVAEALEHDRQQRAGGAK